jgi:hypothetical protein
MQAAESPSWRVGGVGRSGQLIQYAFNAALRKAADRAAYPVRVEVVVHLRAPFQYGLIDAVDLSDVTLIGEIVQEQAAGRAVVAATVTTIGARTFLLYTDSLSFGQELEQFLRSRVTDHAVGVRSEYDHNWNGYAIVTKMRRRSIVGFAVLAAVPLIWAGVAWASYGPGWGIAEFLALCAWIVPFARATFRAMAKRSTWDSVPKRVSWLAYHPGWAFAGCCYLLATVWFFFPAMLSHGHLSPWVSVAISVALGVGLTGVVWPRQLRYYADLRSRAPVS